MIVNKASIETIETAKAEIGKNEFYVPIYDFDGGSMFTSKENGKEIGK